MSENSENNTKKTFFKKMKKKGCNFLSVWYNNIVR